MKKNITRTSNMMSADLAEVFPEFLDFFPDITSKTALAMLERYPVPEIMVKSGMEDILNTMRKCSRNHFKRADAQKILEMAASSVGIPDDGTFAFRIRENVNRIKAELETLKKIEGKIIESTKDNDDVRRVDDIRGIGLVNAAAIVSEIGDIGKFDSVLKLQSYGGKAPMMKGSGGKDRTTGLSKARNPHLSNSVYESAVSLVNNKNKESLEVFNREIGKGKKPTQAYIAVGRRLLYHIFTIMKNHKPYRQRLPRGEAEGVSSIGS